MAQIVATMYSNLLITPKNSTVVIGAAPTKGDHLLVNDALLSGGAAADCQRWKLENVEGLPSDVYTIANQKKDAQGRTLYITADDPPKEKSALYLEEKQTPSGKISKTQLWRVFQDHNGSAANARIQNYTYKTYVMDAPSDRSQPVQLYAWDGNRHKNQLYYFDLN